MSEIPWIMIFFVFTATMVVMFLVKIISIICRSTVSLPAVIPYTGISPSHAVVAYPSALFQVWFWAERLGVFVQ